MLQRVKFPFKVCGKVSRVQLQGQKQYFGGSGAEQIKKLLQSRKYFKDFRLGAYYSKPSASEVLTCHLRNNNYPPWTSYFVKYSDIYNDQFGKSHFNWAVDDHHNYHILRTGCYPYIKYHCTQRPYENLLVEDNVFRIIKVINLGIPCLAYGMAAKYLIKHEESVRTPQGPVTIYYLYEEDKGSMY